VFLGARRTKAEPLEEDRGVLATSDPVSQEPRARRDQRPCFIRVPPESQPARGGHTRRCAIPTDQGEATHSPAWADDGLCSSGSVGFAGESTAGYAGVIDRHPGHSTIQHVSSRGSESRRMLDVRGCPPGRPDFDLDHRAGAFSCEHGLEACRSAGG